MSVSETQRLRQFEAENAKLKGIVAEQALDIVAFKGCGLKKW
jgi:putative transposase